MTDKSSTVGPGPLNIGSAHQCFKCGIEISFPDGGVVNNHEFFDSGSFEEE